MKNQPISKKNTRRNFNLEKKPTMNFKPSKTRRKELQESKLQSIIDLEL